MELGHEHSDDSDSDDSVFLQLMDESLSSKAQS